MEDQPSIREIPEDIVSRDHISAPQAIVIVILFIGILFASARFINPIDPTEDVSESLSQAEFTEQLFNKLHIEAESFVVYSMRDKKLIASRQPELQKPLASLSKVMTALVASEYIADDAVIVIDEDNLQIEGDSGLLAQESWKFDDLRDFTLVVSSNDGSNAMASAVEALPSEKKVAFIDLMNKKAQNIGLSQTYFLNESGLDIEEETQSGSYGSAYDMAQLFSYILEHNPHILEITREETISAHSLDVILHEGENTHEGVSQLAGVLGSKTGFTDLAGGNLVVAFDIGINEPYIIAVLGSSQDGRISDIRKLHRGLLQSLHYTPEIVDLN